MFLASIFSVLQLVYASSDERTSWKYQNEASVSWYAPFLSGGGYCSESIAFIQALSPHIKPLTIHQHGDGINTNFIKGLTPSTKSLLKSHYEKKTNHHRLNILICHSEPGAWNPPLYETSLCPPHHHIDHQSNQYYYIGRTMFETNNTPTGWETRMNRMDEIWVPSTFQSQVFANDGVQRRKLVVMPEPVDTDFFNPSLISDKYHIPNVTSNTFVLLSVFKWEERKGWRILLEAYAAAFDSDSDDVMLVILTNAYHNDLSEIDNIVAQYSGRIHLIRDHVPDSQMPSIYKAASVFILPSKGVGWGRPHVEAMSMGLALIATNWSGPTEYMTPQNSYGINYELQKILTGPFIGHY